MSLTLYTNGPADYFRFSKSQLHTSASLIILFRKVFTRVRNVFKNGRDKKFYLLELDCPDKSIASVEETQII